MDVDQFDVDALIGAAQAARRRAYAPYSGFRVGAAILARAGKVYQGCNVENASYGVTICAERAALCNAVGAGERSWRAIAVYAESPKPPVPCGLCRQALAEFGRDLLVVAATASGQLRIAKLADLLPDAFSAESLAEAQRPAEKR